MTADAIPMNRKGKTMIEVKAQTEVRDGESGVNVTTQLNGASDDIAAEILAIIENLMRGIKRESPLLHLLILRAIVENMEILSGGNDDEFDAKAKMANAMSKGILKGGVN